MVLEKAEVVVLGEEVVVGTNTIHELILRQGEASDLIEAFLTPPRRVSLPALL